MKLKLVLKIVGAIGIAFWIACCFLGLFFASDGNMLVAIPVTLVIAVLLFLSYFLMIKFQDKETRQGNAKNAKTLELVFLTVYLVVMVFSAYYVNHIVKVETEYKDQVRNEARQAIEELKITFDNKEYDFSQKSYRQYVDDQTNSYITQLKKEGSYKGDKDPKIYDFIEYMIGYGQHENDDYNYLNLEKEVNDKLEMIYKGVYYWKMFSVLPFLHDLEVYKPIWEENLMEYSRAKESEKYPFLAEEPFRGGEYYSEYDCHGLSEPLTRTSSQISGMTILIIVVLQIVILLAYLLFIKWGGTRRGPKPSDNIRHW